MSHSLLVDLGVSLAPSSHVYKCKSRPCTGRLVWVSVELTIYSGSLPIFFSPVRSDGEHWRVLFSVKNAVTRLSQEKSLFSSLELAPLVFEVSTHKLNPTHSNPILVPQIRNILSGATDWYLLIAFFWGCLFWNNILQKFRHSCGEFVNLLAWSWRLASNSRGLNWTYLHTTVGTCVIIVNGLFLRSIHKYLSVFLYETPCNDFGGSPVRERLQHISK